MKKIVKVGNKLIGDKNPAFILIELGVTHEQDVELAKKFVEISANSGADAIKVEAFKSEDFAHDKKHIHTYGTKDGMVSENYYNMSKRLELSFDKILEIKKKADECNILFFSTVHNVDDVDLFDELNVCAFKIGSGDLNNFPLIDHISKKKKPVFMDTGAALLSEIDTSLRRFENRGFNDLILMHNPVGYPAPPEKTDLRIIRTLKSVYNVPVGLSCHTPGFNMTIASIALGANVIEKPITRDNSIKGPEHVFSVLDSDVKSYVDIIRNIETCLGSNYRALTEASAHGRRRRGIYAKHNIKEGSIIKKDDLIYLMPNQGISVEHYELIVGKVIKKSYLKNEPIQLKDIKI